MATVIPLNQPSIDLVLAIANAANLSNITFDDVTLSEPIDIESQNTGNNTSVSFISIIGGAYYGNVDIEYDRETFSNLFEEEVVLVSGQLDDHDTVVSLLNATGGLALATDELTSSTIDSDGVVTLTASDGYMLKPGTTVKIRDEFDDYVDRLWQFTNYDLPLTWTI